jgi:hypothetical protein
VTVCRGAGCHIFGCARAARRRCGVIILRIWESLLYGTAHIFLVACRLRVCLYVR